MAFRLLMIALLWALALGKPTRRMQVHEARSHVPAGFSFSGAASPDTMLSLRLALVRSDETGLVEALYDVSTPASANYGSHLSKDEVESLVAPKPESLSAVSAWLEEHGLNATPITPTSDWLKIDMSVGKANKLLATEFSVYTHDDTGKQAIRTLSYSIPADLAGHLDLVHPTIPQSVSEYTYHTGDKRSRLLTTRAGDCLDTQDGITPACLQSLYNIPSAPATNPANQLAVTGYEYQWPLQSDLYTWLQMLRPDMNPNTTYNVVSINGGTAPQNGFATYEGTLDIQYTVGLATNVPVTFYTVGGETIDDNDFVNLVIDSTAYFLNLTAPPQVISTSYGADEDLVSPRLAFNLCNMFAQLGARGVSALFASGDGGVSGMHWNDSCTTFIPVFPATCPYVTSVGGTINIPEQAVNFSAGGFSNYWARPPYQDAAVTSFLGTLGYLDAGLYNASGRGFPDVAAYGDSYEIFINGEVTYIGGTSASTPTFASIISLLNDQLLNAGKSQLGWLNPWLYSDAASTFTDITEGNNYACSDYTTGFNATAGWDPVTGLGTPDFAKLRAATGL